MTSSMSWWLRLGCVALFVLGVSLVIGGQIWEVACGLCLMIVSGCGVAE